MANGDPIEHALQGYEFTRARATILLSFFSVVWNLPADLLSVADRGTIDKVVIAWIHGRKLTWMVVTSAYHEAMGAVHRIHNPHSVSWMLKSALMGQ
jgi:hypothetical protein